jgi:hypothetical protein
MIGNQKQKDDGYVNVGTKVPPHVAELLNIIAQSKGTDIYGLLQLFIQTIIRAAKCETALSPHLKLLMNMIELDSDWNRAFSFASPSAQTDVAQVILILQQHDKEGAKGRPRKGFGMVMIDHPLMPGSKPRCTYCVDSIMERVAEVSMPGIKKDIDEMGRRLHTHSLRETLTLMADAQLLLTLQEADRDELPQLGNYSDFGRVIEYRERDKTLKHRTPDGEANRQQRIMFDDFDRDVADMEVGQSDDEGTDGITAITTNDEWPFAEDAEDTERKECDDDTR